MRHFIFKVWYLSTQRQREVQKARKQWLLSRACVPGKCWCGSDYCYSIDIIDYVNYNIYDIPRRGHKPKGKFSYFRVYQAVHGRNLFNIPSSSWQKSFQYCGGVCC